jgi:spore coat protein H
LLILLIVNSLSALHAQSENTESSFLYSDKDVARIDISIHPDSLAMILQGNLLSDHEYPADFSMSRGSEIKSVKNVGLRLRGNTSRYSQKKSFKVSINSFSPGKKFEGVEKINLNGEHNDPSISRAKICWDLYRESGVPAPRSNHVELYINGEYKGLYLNVEHVDENFTRLWFGNNDGNLYKCLWPADLDYLGRNQELYKYSQGSRRAYELKENEETDDYSDLANFIDVLNNTSDSDFPRTLEPIFDVNAYLKNLVIEVITGHWDAYAYNKNNFYLYHNEETGRFEYIAYDTDNTFGIDWFGIDWAKRDIYSWSHPSENRPLYENLMRNELFRNRYSFYMNRLLNEIFLPATFEEQNKALREMLYPYAVNDFYRTMDYGYNIDDFYNSFEDASSKHVKYGLQTYIDTRFQTALEQLNLVNISPIISLIHSNSDILTGSATFTALVEDEERDVEVYLYYLTGDEFKGVKMNTTANEIYQVNLAGIQGQSEIRYYLEARDNLSQVSREPIDGEYVLGIPTSNPSTYISEHINIYPIPFKNYLNISISGEYSVSYRILDVNGKPVLKGQSTQSEFIIDVNPAYFSPGVYIFEAEEYNSKGVLAGRYYRRIVWSR